MNSVFWDKQCAVAPDLKKKPQMLLLYLITNRLLPSLDPIVNFKASGCEHERLLLSVVICPLAYV